MAGNPPAPARVLKCSNCGASIPIIAQGVSLAAACRHCGSILNLADPNLAVLSQVKDAKKYDPVIPIGARGTLRGDKWANLGYLRRSDGSGVYEWDEYLLYNPTKGFRWLVLNDGHWSFVEMTKERPKLGKQKATYKGKTYKLFLKGKSRVIYVEGEFYWRVICGETSRVADYICPPEMLSMEGNADEVWSLGEYIDGKLVKAAFDVKGIFPRPVGVAPNQQSPFQAGGMNIWAIASVLICLLLVDQCAGYAVSRSKVVLTQSGDLNPQLPEKPAIVTEPFELDGGVSNVEIDLQVDGLQNNWFEMTSELTNTSDGAGYTLAQGVEYWYGTDSDGAWSEGSTRDTAQVSAVPDGTYTLTLDPATDRLGTRTPLHWQLTVTRDAPSFANFWWATLLLLIYPLWISLRSNSFETKRWSNSDFAEQ